MRRSVLQKLLAMTSHAEGGDEPCPICAALFENGKERTPDWVIYDELGETAIYALDREPDDPNI